MTRKLWEPGFRAFHDPSSHLDIPIIPGPALLARKEGEGAPSGSMGTSQTPSQEEPSLATRIPMVADPRGLMIIASPCGRKDLEQAYNPYHVIHPHLFPTQFSE